eukprot:2406225-Rhodomonas_salina.1
MTPSPSNPRWYVHVKLPPPSEHVAFTWQLSSTPQLMVSVHVTLPSLLSKSVMHEHVKLPSPSEHVAFAWQLSSTPQLMVSLHVMPFPWKPPRHMQVKLQFE